jgi:hypothetical protein
MFATLAPPGSARQLAAPASAPTEIRPLLIGAEVPSVEVRDIDGRPVELSALVDGKRTLLIFYRGGW